MRFSRTELVIKKSKDQELRDKVKGKTKHKRLDAICDKAYNRSHGGVEKAESSQLTDGGNVQELRRSGRARKAPELLDSSPLQPKKRRKVDRSVVSSSGNVRHDDRVQIGKGDSSSKDIDGQNDDWESRLRSGDNNLIIYRRKKGEPSLRGKRKLFEDLDGFNDEVETLPNDEKGGLESMNAAVVKSKRLGRTKANDLASENEDIDLGAGTEEDKDKNVDGVDAHTDEVDGLHLENNFDSVEEETAVQSGPHFEECQANDNVEMEDNTGIKNVDGVDAHMDEVDGLHLENNSHSVEEETAVQSGPHFEECQANDNVEMEDNTGIEKLVCDPVHDQKIDTEVNCAADLAKYGQPDKLPVDDTCKRSAEKCRVADQKPRIKLGRRCGLCGGGVEGKPPKVVLDGDSSGNEAYSGSSASEELNYDAFDGFGDDAGWLGRLLGPINDRFGIAGIWVHQQCAVWSPEVYFAGLGCLKNIRAALYRGRMLKCNHCRRPGATIGCRNDRCPKTYHLPCARAKGCVFDHRKFLIACADHRHLFQPHGMENTLRIEKLKSKKMRLELKKISNVAYRQDIEAEEKWMEKFGEDEGFLKRESKRLHRDLGRIAPVYIGGGNSASGTQFQGWESVAGLQGVIQCMKEVVILPLLYPEFFSNIGLTPPRGVLLHGYPGTGKTLVVRALVGACARGDKRIAYFARKGADCLGKYVGDAERQLRLLFQVAEKSQPSIIFFDEIDGLAPVRSKRQDQTHSSVVSTLLALMDGLKSRGSVIVIGATNRPDSVDPALRRPGRFDREIYFPLPSVKDREAILSLHTQKWPKPITGSLLKCVAKQTIGYAGADLQALCTQAAIIALRKSFPLQEVLSASEAQVSRSKYPTIPPFLVEERDWLQALSCAPPPCSRREYGMAVNDVVASPLNTFLVPCFVLPLTKLLVHLCLDERIWLPPALIKASVLVKNVLVSASDRKRLQSDAWWSQVDDLIQDMNVADEIENNLLLANVLVGQTCLSPDVTEEFNDETFSKKFSSNPQVMVARIGFLQNMSDTSCNKSGFQLLISGNSLSGQRHLASCLLHCFVGNVDVWKVDLASISHEGHGDMIHGLTRVLLRCASANLCMIYMPRIDLWAIETQHKSSSELQSPGATSSNDLSENDVKYDLCSNAELEVTESQSDLVKASYLWTCFIEQVESIRVNSSLIILATSELPFSHFPPRVRDFFGSEITNFSLSTAQNHKVPRFCVQLDGKFDPDKVINTAAIVLIKDLAHQFIQSMQNSTHVYDNSMKENSHDKVNTSATSTNNGISSSPVCPINPVTVTNKIVKEKSTLELAISAVGYQILCYPHFAELCWVTSKLKVGPFADIKGPWKGWPFNSCIVRPISSLEKGSNGKSKESSIVRGLAAVGLSAYRCEYKSLREICSEVRKVLESLVGRIDDKVQAGKNRTRFLRILSQAAYLDDMIMTWAHNLRSLEVDAPISEANKSDFPYSNNDKSELDTNKVDLVDLDIQETELEDLIEVDTEGNPLPATGETKCLDENDGNGSNEVIIEGTTKDSIGNTESTKLSNGFLENPPVNDDEIQPNNDITMENNASKCTSESSVCYYKCCPECISNLYGILQKMLISEWECKKGSDSAVESIHDFVACLSVNLRLALGKFLQDGCRNSQEKGGDESENSEKRGAIMECNCHASDGKFSEVGSIGIESTMFVFKNGVMSCLERGVDVDYHCKFEKLCLGSLTEWVAIYSEAS